MGKADLTAAIDYIKNNSTAENWAILSIPTICSQLDISNNTGRLLIIRLRLEPSIRTKLGTSASRFKPKEFYCGTVDEKIKDIKNGMLLFEFSESENKYLVKRLSQFITEEKLRTFLILMFLSEKLKMSGADKKWIKFDILYVSKILDIPESDVLKLLELLEENHILVMSPYTCLYKLIFTDSDYKEAVNEVQEQSSNPLYNTLNKTPEEMLRDTPCSEEDGGNIIGFRNSIKDILKCNNQISNAIESQIKMLKILTTESSKIKSQQIVFSRLNDEYRKLTVENKKLSLELKKASEEKALTDSFIKDYQKNIKMNTDNLLSTIISTLEEYFQLPTYLKNDMTNNNKVKMELTTVIIEYKNNILKYRKEHE